MHKETKQTGRPWIQCGNEYHQMAPSAELTNDLPLGVYTAKLNKQTREMYLERIDDKFTFGYEIYDIDRCFIEHVLKTFHSTVNNLGVLLNGTKGTGKTVCAKIIANELNLPVVLCNEPYEELVAFIAQFNVPAVFFFDEFEKKFEKTTHILLSAMDGAYNTDTRKVFLLTTNQLTIDPNFIGRPSRIRYKKTFGNLSEDIVRVYCEKNLKKKENINEIVAFIDTLKISTIDILKTLVEEINIHDCNISKFKDFFNVDREIFKYTCIVCETNDPNYDFVQFAKDADEYQNSHECKQGKWKGNIGMIKVSTEDAVDKLQVGDKFYDGIIVTPINEDGFMLVDEVWSDRSHGYYDDDNYCQSKLFVKVLNVKSRPSLFKHGGEPANLRAMRLNAKSFVVQK